MARLPDKISASVYDRALLMKVHDYLIQDGPLHPLWDNMNGMLEWYGTDVRAVLQDQKKDFLLPEGAYSPITKRMLLGAEEVRSNPEIKKRLDDFLFITEAVDAIANGMLSKACKGQVFDEKAAVASLDEAFATLSKRGMANLSLPHAAQVFYDYIKPSLQGMVNDAALRTKQQQDRQLPVPVVAAPAIQQGRMEPTYVLMAKRDFFGACFHQESVLALVGTLGRKAGLAVPLAIDKAMVVAAAAHPALEAHLWPSAYREGDKIMRKSPMDGDLRAVVDGALSSDAVASVEEKRVAGVMGAFEQVFALAMRGRQRDFDAARGTLVDTLKQAGIRDANEQVDMAYDTARELIAMYRPSGQGRG